MKLVELEVQARQVGAQNNNARVFKFEEQYNLIFSTTNSVGKTTLLRLLIYALGYNIPNTRGIRFEDFVTKLVILDDLENRLVLCRDRNYMLVESQRDQIGYALPVDQIDLHSSVFGVSNHEVLENLLGAFYLDQEKGWTLLNRGKVIGSVHFSIESLLRGLAGRSDSTLEKQLKDVGRNLDKAQLMLELAEHKARVSPPGDTAVNTLADNVQIQLDVLYSERKPVEDEYRRLQNVVRKNAIFKEFIEAFKLRVKSPDGEPIPVNSVTLLDWEDTVQMLAAKQKLCKEELEAINLKIDSLKNGRHDELVPVGPTVLEQFDQNIARINIDLSTAKKVRQQLSNQQRALKEQVKSSRDNNSLIEKLHELISVYALELGLDEKHVRPNRDYIFTKDLQTLSGAELHKLVFAFKISYVRVIQVVTGISLPIILDSPSGREVSEVNVRAMMAILTRDFTKHQIIIATIHDDYDFPTINKITVEDRLLPF